MRVYLQRNGLYLRHDLSQSTHRRMDVCFYHHKSKTATKLSLLTCRLKVSSFLFCSSKIRSSFRRFRASVAYSSFPSRSQLFLCSFKICKKSSEMYFDGSNFCPLWAISSGVAYGFSIVVFPPIIESLNSYLFYTEAETIFLRSGLLAIICTPPEETFN